MIYYGAACAYKIAQAIPRVIGLHIFGGIGAFAYLFPNREKQRTLDHLRLIYGKEWTEDKIRRTARDVYILIGKNLFDSVFFSGLKKDALEKYIHSDSFDQFRNDYQKGKGCIAITAHIGCFEMLLHYFSMVGFSCFAIGRQSYDDKLEKLIRKARSGPNIEYMERSENIRQIIRWLQQGKVFGVLIDQDTNVEGVFADFLGKTAYTPSGPIKIAMKMGTPVYVVTTARQEDNSHRVFIKKLELVNTGSFDNDLVKNVEAANSLICETIKQYPSQWVWMHRRWKRRPSEEK